MKCKTCNTQMTSKLLQGVYFNLVENECPKCGRKFTEHIKRGTKGANR